MTLRTGYVASSSNVFTISGNPAPAVTQDTDHGGLIVWNGTKFDIFPGLAAGSYPVVMTAASTISPNANFTFTVNVSDVIDNGTFRISASSDAGSSISPSGTVNVTGSTSKTFTFSAKAGFVVSAVIVDGVPQSQALIASGSYTFNNVMANHSISVVSRDAASVGLVIEIEEGKGNVEYSTDGGETFKPYSPGAGIPENSSVVFRAVAGDGNTFVKWVVGDDIFTTEEITLTVTGSILTLQVFFEGKGGDGDNTTMIIIIIVVVLLIAAVVAVIFVKKKA
jgi:hypothetical protein